MGVPPPEEEMLRATVCPSGAPEVTPEMVTAESSAALRRPSPPSSMATEMVGEEESLVVEVEACVAALPAKSLTSAVIVSVPSSREERSRLESE